MRVLVTGATGFVAGHLLPALAEAAHEVVALAHEPERVSAPEGVAVLEADLRNPLDGSRIGRVDAVVHLAQANLPFPARARELFLVNVGSTTALLELARVSGAGRFVLASSGSIYGLGAGPVAEDDGRRASDFYAATKRASELLVGSYRPYLGTTVFRLFTPYGPGQTARLVPRLIEEIRAGRPIVLNGGGRPLLTPIFVTDVVSAILAALERDGHDVVNVAGDEVVGIGELAELIGDALGRAPMFVEGGTAVAGDLVADNARLRQRYLTVPLVPLRAGLRATIRAEAIV